MTETRLRGALATARADLLSERTPEGHWVGALSSSALSTATAITALTLATRGGFADPIATQPLIAAGYQWLRANVNQDGGWGDTTLSVSNVSTTALVWACFGLEPSRTLDPVEVGAEQWLRRACGSMEPEALASTIIARYGNDRTFSVPILTHCALCGRLGAGRRAWRRVIPLPFELSVAPQRWFAALRLPVVSYALPALIAIGAVRHVQAPSKWPWVRLVRQSAAPAAFRRLEAIQPPNGGFLEATPLTSFVLMSLVSSGQGESLVAARAIDFLIASALEDGSWAIDSNLSTWVTTLSSVALTAHGQALGGESSAIVQWLLEQQYRSQHPYTGAAPGGWAWTDLSGGVPDADDTSGALLALSRLAPEDTRSLDAARRGATWLLGLQNTDGGIPTFCRGWGKLDFDRSCADITAHAIRAWDAWDARFEPALRDRVGAARVRALAFLERNQAPDGSWAPLWFGAQSVPDEINRVYGTSRALLALDKRQGRSLRRGIDWLLAARNENGSWGGSRGAEGSTEETALALEGLADVATREPGMVTEAWASAMERGARWLVDRVENGKWRDPEPIGFYFAKLWYYERLYPRIFTVAALESVASWRRHSSRVDAC